MRQLGEPSVEEILDSIKKVIARDNREIAQAERRRRETQGLAADAAPKTYEDEILDLDEASEIVEENSTIADNGQSDDGQSNEGLTTDASADAMRQSLAALAMLAEPSVPPQIVRSGETSMEGLVREMLRPMMAQWLDAHLPPIVERMVKEEISRIAGKKR